MKGFVFSAFVPEDAPQGNFDSILDIFLQLLSLTGGNVPETLEWLTQLDQQYGFSSPSYGIGDFIDELKAKGYIQENPLNGNLTPGAKSGNAIRKRSLEEVFGKLKKGRAGNHQTPKSGKGDEANSDTRKFEFGDNPDQINLTASLHQAQINHGIDDFHLTEEDLEVSERDMKTQTATVLMIDISHSMILYGEDRITPAKKVAMALAEMIRIKYPKDTLDIIVFGNDAWTVALKDLPYLNVGPYHTNTYAGLELALELLRKRKAANKQILMITDGKPTCIKEGARYYQNSFGLDRKIINKTLTMAARARKLRIPITTFMIASDPYLKDFVHEFTETNQGRAYYSKPDGLGNFMMEDFERNRIKRI